MVTETVATVKQNDFARGDYCMLGNEMNVWVDVSFLANGVLLEKNVTAIEAASERCCHINLAELDAVLKSINLALQWEFKKLHVPTDSLCVLDTLTGKSSVRTEAATEIIIRRLSTFKKLVTEY